MNANDYEHIRAAFNELGQIGASSCRTIDKENVTEARRQLAWSLRRWGTEYEVGVPPAAARLAPDAETSSEAIVAGPHDQLREAASLIDDAGDAISERELDVDEDDLPEGVSDDTNDIEGICHGIAQMLRKHSVTVETRVRAAEGDNV